MSLCSEEYGVLIQNSKQILMNPKKILKKQPKFEDFYLKFDPQGPGTAAHTGPDGSASPGPCGMPPGLVCAALKVLGGQI